MRRLYLILLILSAGCAIPPANPSLAEPLAVSRAALVRPDDAEFIRAKLAALPQTGGTSLANAQNGGIVEIPAGTFTITRPILVPDSAVIRGQGGNTRIVNNGKGPAFVFHSPYGRDNGMNLNSRIEDLQISSDIGGGVSCDDSVLFLRGTTLRNLTISTAGPAIELKALTTEFPTISHVDITQPGAEAVVFTGTALTIDALKVMGFPRKGYAAKEGQVVIRGSASIDGFTQLESNCPVPYLAVLPQPNGAPSMVTIRDMYLEAHLPGKPVVDILDSYVTSDWVGVLAPSGTPWRVRGKSTLRFTFGDAPAGSVEKVGMTDQ
jgi:hypothetical protein